MAQSLVNFRMDEELKQNMEQTCQELGMNMTTAFTIFAKKMTREKRIPFEVSVDPFYSASNIKYLEKVVSEIDSGKAKLREHDLIEDQRMKLLWDDRAQDDYIYWQNQDKKTLKRINAIVKDIQRERYAGIGTPEPLTGNLSGWWSRRIDEENRIVYKEENGAVIIASCKGHYED